MAGILTEADRFEFEPTALDAALVTIRRGCAFLAAAPWPDIAGGGRTGGDSERIAMTAGNGLRELDRFLNILLDEAARQISPPSLDLRRFERRRDAANKLNIVRAMLGLAHQDRSRLREIGERRLSLLQGRLRATDFGPSPCLSDLKAICHFYGELADALMRDLAGWRQSSSRPRVGLPASAIACQAAG